MSVDVWPYLIKKYPTQEYALLREVRNGTGSNANRSADGIVMSLWPSRGLEMYGIEIKSHRNDWLREIKQPAKAEAFFQYCDRWWLVTADDKVAKMEEIPPTWGWMAIKGTRMVVMKDAPKLDPVPLSKTFVAGLLQRAVKGMIHESAIEGTIDAKVQEQVAVKSRYLQDWEKEFNVLRKAVDEFQEASGVEINQWNPRGKVGGAVRLIVQGGPDIFIKRMEELGKEAQSIYDKINSHVVAMKTEQTNQPSCTDQSTPQTT